MERVPLGPKSKTNKFQCVLQVKFTFAKYNMSCTISNYLQFLRNYRKHTLHIIIISIIFF